MRNSDALQAEPRVEPLRVEASARPAALAVLYAEYGPLIRARCSRLLRDPAAGEDALHDVFLRVSRHAGHLPEAEFLRAWLLRVATNHCLNELRNRGVRTRNRDHWGQFARSSPEEVLSARGDVRRLLAALPVQARAVAWLTYVDGMLQREVAAELGVSRRTVVNHLSRMRQCVEHG